MQLSRKSDYAIRALIYLADQLPDQLTIPLNSTSPVSVRDLAERNDIPRKYLESIMSDLKGAGLVESVAGKSGGYRLSRTASMITLGDIIRLFDGSLFSAAECESGTKSRKTATNPGNIPEVSSDRNKSSAQTARVQRMLLHIGSELNQLLDSTTLQHILEDKPIHYLITNQDEFAFGDGI